MGTREKIWKKRRKVIEGKWRKLNRRRKVIVGKWKKLNRRRKVIEGKWRKLNRRRKVIVGKWRKLNRKRRAIVGKWRKLNRRRLEKSEEDLNFTKGEEHWEKWRTFISLKWFNPRNSFFNLLTSPFHFVNYPDSILFWAFSSDKRTMANRGKRT